MKKFKCEICNKKLHLNTYKARNMHINGSKHKIMKETYFLELLENKDIVDEISAHKKLMGPEFETRFNKQNFGFRIPPCYFPENFVIPPEPKNFRLPNNFVFTDKKNYKTDINETLQKLNKKSD